MKPATIAQFVQIPSQIAYSMEMVHEYQDKRMPAEEFVVKMHALVIGAVRERDHDFHIEIADLCPHLDPSAFSPAIFLHRKAAACAVNENVSSDK
jgi:hypothetical protein